MYLILFILFAFREDWEKKEDNTTCLSKKQDQSSVFYLVVTCQILPAKHMGMIEPFLGFLKQFSNMIASHNCIIPNPYRLFLGWKIRALRMVPCFEPATTLFRVIPKSFSRGPTHESKRDLHLNVRSKL